MIAVSDLMLEDLGLYLVQHESNQLKVVQETLYVKCAPTRAVNEKALRTVRSTKRETNLFVHFHVFRETVYLLAITSLMSTKHMSLL
jgi:hypothetical protein